MKLRVFLRTTFSVIGLVSALLIQTHVLPINAQACDAGQEHLRAKLPADGFKATGSDWPMTAGPSIPLVTAGCSSTLSLRAQRHVAVEGDLLLAQSLAASFGQKEAPWLEMEDALKDRLSSGQIG